MQILISWSRVSSKSRFRSFVKILFWVENPLLWRGIRDGQNSCCTCHNTKGWKHICVLRKQAGNKLTVHSSFLCTYSVLRFWFRWFYTEKTHWKLHLEKTSEAFNLRPNQRTYVRGRKKPSVGKTLHHAAQTTCLPSHSSSSEWLDISLRSRRPATVSNRSCCNVSKARCGVIFSFKQDNRPPGADSSSRGQCPPSSWQKNNQILCLSHGLRRKWF